LPVIKSTVYCILYIRENVKWEPQMTWEICPTVSIKQSS